MPLAAAENRRQGIKSIKNSPNNSFWFKFDIFGFDFYIYTRK